MPPGRQVGAHGLSGIELIDTASSM